MAIITLTTDMGVKDHYVAVVKGSILGQAPGAVIVDISHQIPPFDNAQAAFVLRNAAGFELQATRVERRGALPAFLKVSGLASAAGVSVVAGSAPRPSAAAA